MAPEPGPKPENIPFTRFMKGSCAASVKVDDGISYVNVWSWPWPRVLAVSWPFGRSWRDWNMFFFSLASDNRLYCSRDDVLLPDWMSVTFDTRDGVCSMLLFCVDFLGVFPDVCLDRFLFSINLPRKSRIAAPQALGHTLPRIVKWFRISKARSASLCRVRIL